MEPVQQELVGRSTEQAAIARLLEVARHGTRCLLLEGEAGIGKTSLWKAARTIAARRGHRLLSAAPTEAETGLPYAVLGDLLEGTPEDAFASLSVPLRTALEVALLKAPAKQEPTDQLAVSSAFLHVLRHLAADSPLLVALDDIQWIDGPSMRIIAFALHRLEHERVNVLAALRVPSTGDAGATLQRALGHAGIERLGSDLFLWMQSTTCCCRGSNAPSGDLSSTRSMPCRVAIRSSPSRSAGTSSSTPPWSRPGSPFRCRRAWLMPSMRGSRDSRARRATS